MFHSSAELTPATPPEETGSEQVTWQMASLSPSAPATDAPRAGCGQRARTAASSGTPGAGAALRALCPFPPPPWVTAQPPHGSDHSPRCVLGCIAEHGQKPPAKQKTHRFRVRQPHLHTPIKPEKRCQVSAGFQCHKQPGNSYAAISRGCVPIASQPCST